MCCDKTVDCRFRTVAVGVFLRVLRNFSEVPFQKHFWKLTDKHLLQSSLLDKLTQCHSIRTMTTVFAWEFNDFFFKIPAPQVIPEKLFIRKMFCMCVKWIFYKTRLLAEKVKSFLLFGIRGLLFGELYAKRGGKSGFFKDGAIEPF